MDTMEKESKEDIKTTAETMEQLQKDRTIHRSNVTKYVNQLKKHMESKSKIEALLIRKKWNTVL